VCGTRPEAKASVDQRDEQERQTDPAAPARLLARCVRPRARRPSTVTEEEERSASFGLCVVTAAPRAWALP